MKPKPLKFLRTFRNPSEVCTEHMNATANCFSKTASPLQYICLSLTPEDVVCVHLSAIFKIVVWIVQPAASGSSATAHTTVLSRAWFCVKMRNENKQQMWCWPVWSVFKVKFLSLLGKGNHVWTYVYDGSKIIMTDWMTVWIRKP